MNRLATLFLLFAVLFVGQRAAAQTVTIRYIPLPPATYTVPQDTKVTVTNTTSEPVTVFVPDSEGTITVAPGSSTTFVVRWSSGGPATVTGPNGTWVFNAGRGN